MPRKRNSRLLRLAARPVCAALLFGLVGTTTLSQAAITDTPTQVQARVTSSEAKTRNPIVLVHGLFGFDNVLGIDYFYRIPESLAGAGAKVYVAQLSGANSSEIRGEQLIQELKNLRALSGNPSLKFNLVGHSQGAPTARYVAAVEPGLVASVTSVGGANGGSKVADLLRKIPEGSASEAVVAETLRLAMLLLGAISGKDPSQLPEVPLNALNSLTTVGGAAFDKKFPQGRPAPGSSCDVKSGPAEANGVRYYSWSGVQPLTNAFDASDVAMGGLSLIAFGSETNDGLLAVCSTRLGTHLGDYRQNHLDEVNQLFGLTYIGLWTLFEKKPVQLYQEQAARLKSAGL
ncbi:triacylglycerol lipase [Variovorax sp. 770b2]|uniref:lipase family alpha/beta hydrolase n=1 Tax=Variovorax sp. 770b2 TaxID=1566271 RepID=UPI0008EEEE5A|nr:triacylglycerol lipase [Variovorax sp. 770b2]SFQ20276.1 triacylglycerol lipase [Variovorax sp. 770b2]